MLLYQKITEEQVDGIIIKIVWKLCIRPGCGLNCFHTHRNYVRYYTCSAKKNLRNQIVAYIFATNRFHLNGLIMKKKILALLCILTGLVFINAGLDKFFHYMPVPEDLPDRLIRAGKAFMEIGWLLPLTGAVEIGGGLLLLFARTRTLGALLLLPVLAGILLANISLSPSGLPVALILFAIVAWIMIENRKKYAVLISR